MFSECQKNLVPDEVGGDMAKKARGLKTAVEPSFSSSLFLHSLVITTGFQVCF